MTKHLLAATAAIALAASGLGVHSALANAPDAAPVEAADRIDNFRLVDADGRSHDLFRLRDAKAIVLVTHAVGAKDMKATAAELKKLEAAYASKDVEFLMLNSTTTDSREAAAADVAALGLDIPVMMDDLQLVGGQIGASRTSEAFVIDPKSWNIVYHGALTKKLATGSKPKGKSNYVADALDAVIAGSPVAVETVAAKGAQIAFPDRTPEAKASFEKISYSKTVAPILEEKCVACHQEGGIAPFSMDNYQVVRGFAPMIREAIRTDRMPPWDADPHVGKFKDDKSLTAQEIKTIVNWVEAGAPRGEGPDPLAAEKHVAPDWPLGKPDLIVDIPAFTVPAKGIVDYQYPVVDNPLTEGKWLKASTAKVNARQAVHHILSGIIPAGATQKGMEAWGGSVGGYTVGMESVVQPKGIGTYIPAGGEFAYQMHYTPYGKEETSAEQIGLYFYKDGEKPDLMMRENALVDSFIKIPPYDGNHKEVAYFLFPKDAVLHSAVVHAHYRGTYSKLEVRYPDGRQETILNVPFYDFNWQRMYEFDQPISIPAGSKVIATYIYDNSARNPANPDPSKEITWGDQSFEEMFYTSLRYRWLDETAENQTNYDELLLSSRLMGMLDDNIDDKIQESELRGGLGDAIRPKFQLADANHDGGIDAKEFAPILKMMQARGRKGGGDASGD